MFAKQTNRSFNKIYAFEPDIGIFEMSKEVAGIDYMSGRFELFSCGLSNKNGTVRFEILDKASSRICENGEVEIETRRLDDAIKDAVSFIKIDAEGSELAILQGAENTIKANKPKLAVCIYHKIEDLWELPLYINELVPKYRLFIRHYHPSRFESVVYAVMP